MSEALKNLLKQILTALLAFGGALIGTINF